MAAQMSSVAEIQVEAEKEPWWKRGISHKAKRVSM